MKKKAEKEKRQKNEKLSSELNAWLLSRIGFDASQPSVLSDLQRADRSPFVRILSDIIGCAPTRQALIGWAQGAPDKWAFMLGAVAKLAGFTDKLDINLTHLNDVKKLSDIELMQELEKRGMAGEWAKPIAKGSLIEQDTKKD